MNMPSIRLQGPRAGWSRSAARWSRSPLAVFAAGMAVMTVLFAVGIAADPRTIAGHPAWLKPFKFGVSITIYVGTIAWMLTFVRSDRRWVRGFVRAFRWIAIGVFVLEMGAIATQVVRGTTSHFNVATPFDAAVWSVMAVSIMALWGANLALAGVLFFQRFANPVVGWSVRLGVAIAVLGMGQAFLMTSPTAQQLAGWTAGGAVSTVGAHSVGAPDGGAGMAVTGWRTDAGDLRVGHFVGIHGLQAIPLLGWLLLGRRRLRERQKVVLVWIGAAAYSAFLGLVTWQALRGQPLLLPDALTLGALGALAAATVLAVAVVLVRRAPIRGRAGG